MIRVACLGECMVELREKAPRLYAQGFAGDTWNTAVYLKRLGGERLSVDFASGVGGDAFADDMLAAWREEDIGTQLVRRIEGRSTGLYSIRTDADGERHFSYWRDASAARAYFDCAITPLEESADAIDLLYLSGITLAVMSAALPDRLPALARRLQRRGARVAFDNNYRPRLWPDRAAARAAFDRLYACADIAFVTLDDATALDPGQTKERALAEALALPCAEVVVKRGAEPTLLRCGGTTVEVPVETVDRVVDTTAAGDSFAAGYLAERLAGAAPEAAAALGNRLAALVIQHPGAIVEKAAMASFRASARVPKKT